MVKIEKQLVKSIPELEALAQNVVSGLETTERGVTIIGLSGDLGSGKTAFVKAIAKALKIKEAVLSPTFVLAKFYEIPGQSTWSRMVHIDAYRIEDENELKALRWDEIKSDPRNLVLVEWPERLGDAFPKECPVLQFLFVSETAREIMSLERDH